MCQWDESPMMPGSVPASESVEGLEVPVPGARAAHECTLVRLRLLRSSRRGGLGLGHAPHWQPEEPLLRELAEVLPDHCDTLSAARLSASSLAT